MKLIEMRLGNIVKCTDVEYCFVDSINISGVTCIQSNNGVTWRGNLGVSFIPLSEEWLCNFGLEENIFSDRIDKRYNLPDDRYIIHLSDDGDHSVVFEGNTLTYIKHVHQLQNLYFELTGDELIIKNG